nr:DNA ligase 4 [Parasteatoda tepidariorum]
MPTVAEEVPFLSLCKLCNKISEKKGKDKVQLLKDFIDYWRKFHNKLHQNNPNETDSFYPAMRLLLPQCERQRAAYGIKEFTFAKLLIEIFCLDKNSVDAQKLINYRSPKTAKAEAGDFASVAFFVLKNRSPEVGSLKVSDINQYLDNIASNNASKHKDELKNDLLYLLRNTSALEQKWLIRMILKEMKLGISENSILKAYHADAKDLFNVTNSLEKVCLSLKNPETHLHEIEVSLFAPFRPMLSEMALPNQVEQLMKNKPFIIETKYDGERLQLHKDGTSYMYFSRGGFDCTDTYGSSPLQGKFTPHIHNSFKTSTKSCILDGEIVIYSNKLNCIVSKGENADIQALEPDGDFAPCFCVFDILMLNDKVLTNYPVTERVSFIKDTFSQIENKIRYTDQIIATTNTEVNDELNKAIDGRLEGIVVKNPESVYKPNIRKGGGWLKVKPEYIENLMNELDLLIIGGYYGEGRRSNIISHFLLAVASNEQKDSEPKCYYSFAKVGSGYTFKELLELSAKIEQHWQKYDPKKPPKNLIIGGGRKEQPDLWIEPSKSLIVQVKASEINGSKSFATNCTLRFPRVEKIRYDKSWRDCMTMRELEDLRNLAQGRLATRRSTVTEAEEEPSPKKQKMQKERIVSIAPHFRPTDISNVQQVTDIFKNKEMCVIFSSLEKKQEVEKKIAQSGGKLVQNPGNGTFCIICDKITAKVKNLINKGIYDVVKEEWIENCYMEGLLLQWKPDDLYHAKQETCEKLGQFYDKYGDNFTEDVSENSLKRIFSSISEEEWLAQDMTNQKIVELEKNYFPDSLPCGLFRGCWIFIKGKHNEAFRESIEVEMKLLSLKLKMFGANICSKVENRTTHIVLPRFTSMDNNPTQKRIHVVTDKWARRLHKK